MEHPIRDSITKPTSNQRQHYKGSELELAAILQMSIQRHEHMI